MLPLSLNVAIGDLHSAYAGLTHAPAELVLQQEQQEQQEQQRGHMVLAALETDGVPLYLT